MKITHTSRPPRLQDSLRQILYTACGILCVSALLCTAILFPKYYCIFHDNNTWNKVVFTEIPLEISTYEAAYASFAEKIHVLAQADFSKNSFHAVQTNELGIKMDKKELTKIANKEFKKLYHLHVLESKIQFKAKKMTLCERYTIYGTSGQDTLKGISLYKLAFENKKRAVTLYLDEEYHKIYYLEKRYKDSTVSPNQRVLPYTASQSSTKDPWIWWNGISRYFGLPSYSQLVSQELGKTGSLGILTFQKTNQEKQDQIVLFNEHYYDEAGQQFQIIGIALEQMIQF